MLKAIKQSTLQQDVYISLLRRVKIWTLNEEFQKFYVVNLDQYLKVQSNQHQTKPGLLTTAYLTIP